MSPIKAIDIFVGPTGSVDFACAREDPETRTPLLTASKARMDVMDFLFVYLFGGFVMGRKVAKPG